MRKLRRMPRNEASTRKDYYSIDMPGIVKYSILSAGQSETTTTTTAT